MISGEKGVGVMLVMILQVQAWRNCRSVGPDRQIFIWSGRFNQNVGPCDRQNKCEMNANISYFFKVENSKSKPFTTVYIMKMKSLIVLMFAISLLRTISKSNWLHNTYFKLSRKIGNCFRTF